MKKILLLFILMIAFDAAASCDKSNLEDSNMSMYIFDKLRLYMVSNDLRLKPISEIRLNNVSSMNYN